MSKVVIEDTSLTAIGNAIRTKTGKTDLLLPSEMPAAIESISGGGGGGGQTVKHKHIIPTSMTAEGLMEGFNLWDYTPQGDFSKLVSLSINVGGGVTRGSLVWYNNMTPVLSKDGDYMLRATKSTNAALEPNNPDAENVERNYCWYIAVKPDGRIAGPRCKDYQAGSGNTWFIPWEPTQSTPYNNIDVVWTEGEAPPTPQPTGPAIPMLPPGQNIMNGRDGGLIEQRWVTPATPGSTTTVQDLGFDSIEDFASRCVFIAGMMSTIDGYRVDWQFRMGYILPWLRQDVDKEIIEGGLDRTNAPSKRENWPLFGIVNNQAIGTYSSSYMSNNGVGYNERWYQGNKKRPSVGMTLMTPGTSAPDRYWCEGVGCWGVDNNGVFKAELYRGSTGAYETSRYLFSPSYPIMVYSLKK